MKCMSCGKMNYKGAVFCRFCGSNLKNEATSASTLSDSEKHCRLCGDNTPDDAENILNPPKAPDLQKQEESKTSDNTKKTKKTVRSSNTAQALPQKQSKQTFSKEQKIAKTSSANEKKRLPAGRVFLFLLIIMAVVFSVSKISDYFDGKNGGSSGIADKPGISFKPSDYNTKGETAQITAKNKIVTVNGVAVDLLGIPIKGQQTLEVKKLPLKTNETKTIKVNAYDITLSGMADFDTYVRVSIPYTAKENEYSFIQYYNQKTRTWELIPSDVDKTKGTITFATNHFSTFAEFVQINGQDFSDKTSAFAYLGGYKNPLSKVYLVEKKLNAKLDQLDPSAVEKLLKYGEFPTSDGITATLSLINDLTNASGTTSGSATLLKLFSQSTLTKMGPAFLAIGATATLTRCVYQWNQGDSAWNIIKDNGVNLAELGLTTAGIAYGSPLLLAGAAGIWAAGLAYDNWPKSEYSSVVEKAYHKFNTDHMCFVTELGVFLPYGQYYTGSSNEKYFIHTAQDGKFNFEEIFNDLENTYLKKKKDPKRLAEIIVKMTETYSDSFWQIDAGKRDLYIESVNQKEPRMAQYPNTSLYDEKWSVTPKQIAAYKENMKNSMIYEMKPYLERVIYNLTYQIRKDLYDRIRTQLEPWLNQTITVEITDLSLKNGETFDKSAMAAYDVRFLYNSMTSITDKENWNFSINEKSNKVFEMTLFNYIKAGCPREVGFYEKGKTKPVLTAAFEFSEPVIKIVLDKQDYSGIYTGTSYGQPLLGGDKFELKYNAIRIQEKENGILVGPCLENGDYESELQVLCKYNANTQRYEGKVKLEEGRQWTELIFTVNLKNNAGANKAEVAYIQHFSNRSSMGYAYNVTWKSPVSGAAIVSRQPSKDAPQVTTPAGRPVGGF